MSNDDKSWRDRDRANDRSRHGGQKGGRGNKSESAGAAYKADLEALFNSGGAVPDRFKGLTDKLRESESEDDKAWRLAVQAMRDADGFRAFATAASEFQRAGHALPDDEDLLLKLLDHPSERVIIAALEHFLDLRGRRELSRTAPLRTRLTMLRTVTEDRRALALVAELEGLL